MRPVLCLVGRHRWVRRHNPEVDGAKGDYHVCARCGREQNTYESGNPSFKGPLIG